MATDAKPFNPAEGDEVIATDAGGADHLVTVVRGPWRGGYSKNEFVKVTIRFADGAELPWPLCAVRPVAALGIQEGGSTDVQ